MKYTEMKNPIRRFFTSYDRAWGAWAILESLEIRADIVKATDINPAIFDENDYYVFFQTPDVLQYND